MIVNMIANQQLAFWIALVPLAGAGLPALAQSQPLVECVRGLTALGVAADQALEACRGATPATGAPPQPSSPTTGAVGEFVDIAGVFGEREIRQLRQLGIIEADSPYFRPQDPITRGEFIIWLVRAFNTYYPERPMRYGPAPRFSDTSATASYSRYLGAIQDAGFVVGFADGTFRPEALLNREQMIAIKARVDTDGRDNRDPAALRRALQPHFDDVAQFDDEFLPFIAHDHLAGGGWRNFQRVYGTTRNYRPKQPVTRAEAAVLLSRFDRERRVTAERVLQQRRP